APDRHPGGSVRPEPADAAAAAPPARAAGGREGARRAGHRRRARDTRERLARAFDDRRRSGDIPGRKTVRLEDDDVVVVATARGLAGHHLLQLVYLEPVEHPDLDRLDQVGRLEARVVDRVAADEARALEHDVVELAAAPVGCADGTDERARLQPLAAKHRIGRARDGDHDVALGRIAMALAGLGPVPLAEVAEP